MTGEGQLASANTLRVETTERARGRPLQPGDHRRGSEQAAPGTIPAVPRISDSTAALEISFIPERMLVLGGGIIGLEMARSIRRSAPASP